MFRGQLQIHFYGIVHDILFPTGRLYQSKSRSNNYLSLSNRLVLHYNNTIWHCTTVTIIYDHSPSSNNNNNNNTNRLWGFFYVHRFSFVLQDVTLHIEGMTGVNCRSCIHIILWYNQYGNHPVSAGQAISFWFLLFNPSKILNTIFKGSFVVSAKMYNNCSAVCQIHFVGCMWVAKHVGIIVDTALKPL